MGYSNFATVHIVTNNNYKRVKDMTRKTFKECGIDHVTIEIENECCNNKNCSAKIHQTHHHH